MRIPVQISIIFTVCIAGEIISSLVPFTVPASVMSMILLFLLLISGVVRREHINSTSEFLLGHMAFFFVPAGVGLIESFPLFSDKLLRLLAVCTINTLLTFIVTAYTVTFISKLIKRRNQNE